MSADVDTIREALRALYESGWPTEPRLAEITDALAALDRLAAAEARRVTLAEAAGPFARDFLHWVENEAPAEWDGGDLGYTMGGFASMAQETVDALVAVTPTEAKP